MAATTNAPVTVVSAAQGWTSHTVDKNNPSDPIGSRRAVVAWSVDIANAEILPVTLYGTEQQTVLTDPHGNCHFKGVFDSMARGDATEEIGRRIHDGKL